MSREDYRSVVKLIKQFRETYKQHLTSNMISDLNVMLDSAKSGEKTYGELLDQIGEYEAQYGHAISKQYEQVKRDRNR